MEWTFKVRGKPVTLNILEEVTAVRPAGNFPPNPISIASSLLVGHAVEAEVLEDVAGVASSTDRKVFRNAGWHFVHPFSPVALAAEFREDIGSAAAIRQVFATESGNLMIGTNLATVQMRPDMTRAEIEETLQNDGLEIVYELGFARSLFEVRLLPGPPYSAVIDKLQANTNRYVFAEPSLLEIITGRLKPLDVDLDKQWQHAKPPVNGQHGSFGINSLDAWDVTRGRLSGRAMRIAIIDRGMQISHPEFKDAIIGGGYFSPANGDPATPQFFPFKPGMTDFPDDIEDHGTFCMGMAGARMNNEGPGCGSAPEADLIAIACAHDQTSTQTTLARAIELAVKPPDATPEQGGADVISCSLATNGVFREVLKKAVDCATRCGRNNLGTPIFWAVDNAQVPIADTDVCSDEAVIAVGRSDRQGKPECAFGARLAFVAPGTDVFSTRSDGQFNHGDGTSFATPLAAGVAALVLSVKPDLTAKQVGDLLRESCEPVEKGHDDETGRGRLNAAIAVTKAKLL